MLKTVTIPYIATLVVFAAIDFIWLSIMAGVLYKPTLGDVLAPEPRFVPAVIFYLVFAAGLAFFAVRPALASFDLGMAFLYGAIFGFMAYATYDLTNHATLRNWTATLTIVDLAWGTVLSGCSAAAATWIASRIP